MKIALVAAALILSAPVFARHGWSEYDQGTTLTLEGRVQEMGYEHPHGFVTLATKTKTWVAVLAPPSPMDNRGLPEEMLKAGTPVTLVGYANRSNPEEMRTGPMLVPGKTTAPRCERIS